MKDLTKGNELKTIIYFSLPILIGNLFQQIYNISDTIIVGNFLGKTNYKKSSINFKVFREIEKMFKQFEEFILEMTFILSK